MVLDNAAFKQAFVYFDAEFLNAVLCIPDEAKYDADLRRAQMMLKMSKKFQGILIGMINKGNDAQRRIDRVKDLRDVPKAKQFLMKVMG